MDGNKAIFITTFLLFFIEAVVHWNIGLQTGKELQFCQMRIPKGKDLWNIVGVLAVFSGLNTFLVPYATKLF